MPRRPPSSLAACVTSLSRAPRTPVTVAGSIPTAVIPIRKHALHRGRRRCPETRD